MLTRHPGDQILMLDMCPHSPGGSVHGPLPKVSLCSVVLMGLNGQLHSAQGGWKFQISHLTKTHHLISHTALTRTQSTQLYPSVLGGGQTWERAGQCVTLTKLSVSMD